MKREILEGLRTGRPVLVWGPPGVGKTSVAYQMAADLELTTYTLIGSIREPSDILGFPVVDGHLVRLAAPDWAERLARADQSLLIIDELTTCPPAVQAALLRVVLEGVVGDLRLDNTLMLALANPPEQVAGYDLLLPMLTRFIHLPYELKVDEWVENFPAYWGNPPTLPCIGGEGIRETAWAPARSLTAAFIRRRPELLLQVPSQEQAGLQGGWPCPRSWDTASRLLAGPERGRLTRMAGAVGEGAALEFINWLEQMDLPDPEALLASPGSFHLPERGDQQFAVLASVATAVVGQLDEGRWAAGWQIMGRAATEGAPDVAAVAVRSMAKAGLERALPWPKEVEAFLPLLQDAGML